MIPAIAIMGLAMLFAPTVAAEPVALTGVRLIDGIGAKPIEDATVVIDKGRIVSAGPAPKRLPYGTTVRDYRGRIVMPGLISDHSHVGQVRGVTSGTPNYTRENIVAALRAYEAKGVTTVMALGLNGAIFPSIRAEAHAGRLPGADVFGVDRGIGVPDGAPPQSMLKVGPDQLFRPSTPEQAREAIRAMKARGGDMAKLWLDDFGGSVPVKMKPEIYKAAINEAHTQGLRVAAHVHDLEDARAIVLAGADVVAHGVRDKPVDAAFVQLLKSSGTWYIPTLALDEATFIYADRPAWTRTPFVRDALSPELTARFDDPAWRSKTLADPKTAAARKSLAINLRNLKTLYDAGVKIGFGTDSGAAPERIPGVAEHRELVLMVEAGLTPLQAIGVATANAAALLKLDDRGTLTTGRLADLVVLSSDPSESIEDSVTIIETWHRGISSTSVER
ncbi:amidohydrolase family protein [Sphingomonas ginsenosidivorax]|uniref:Amidohydrolase family protein n=2 Tax=Sphingomonas ginsenosidivorax TaxID=862135 RepID=A0A5C6U5Q0_9SPHN|nr:amidohydrolase family protein [Sphingomonas ginsenosidivorax]